MKEYMFFIRKKTNSDNTLSPDILSYNQKNQYKEITFNIILFLLASFVGYGRFNIQECHPACIYC